MYQQYEKSCLKINVLNKLKTNNFNKINPICLKLKYKISIKRKIVLYLQSIFKNTLKSNRNEIKVIKIFFF
ncbi:MAG: hypothetical protein EAZ27_11025 [Cytophagales bacterium]|nr:MAG: hypothetical protein EAZ27_11025 [Cytophagales bacterium]